MGDANVIGLWLKSLASRDSRHGDAVKSRVKSIMDISSMNSPFNSRAVTGAGFLYDLSKPADGRRGEPS